MKLESLLIKLEDIRKRAEGQECWLDKEITVLEVVQALLEYVNNPKVEEKVDAIPF